jgi:ubiquitin carboxyl-terminal hydrolase 25/28
LQEADGLSAAALLRETQRRLLDVETLENETKLEPDFEGIGITPNLLGGLEQYAQKADDTLEGKGLNKQVIWNDHADPLLEIDQQINDTQSMIANQFSDYDNLPYRLYAVFVHHGSVSFGHYYIYIFDFDKNIWRKYNDEYVTEVQNLDEIFKSDSTTNPPTPYFLCYVNSAMKERLASPVCREMNEMMTDVPDVPDRSTSPMGSIRFDPPSYDEASASKSTTGTADNLNRD